MRSARAIIAVMAALALPFGGSGAHVAASARADGQRLSYDEILTRCLPQLQRGWQDWYSEAPSAANTVVRNLEIDHAKGDFASFSQDRLITLSGEWEVNPNLCRIPAAGHENDPVDASVFTPAPTDDNQLRALCTEADGTLGALGVGDVVNRDLRKARVILKAARGKQVQLVLEDQYSGLEFGCSLGVNGWNALASLVPAQRIAVTAGVAKGQDVYTAVGLASAKARKLIVTDRRGITRSTKVKGFWSFGNPSAAYAFFLAFPRDKGYGTLKVRFVDKRGTVLSTATWDNVTTVNGH